MTKKSTFNHDPLDRLAGFTPLGEATIQKFYNRELLSTEVQASRRFSILRSNGFLHAQQSIETHRRSTTLLFTDASHSVLIEVGNAGQRPFAYMPYGFRPFPAGTDSLLAFNGERLNAVTGHYLLGNGHRAFNPTLMRFNSPDKLSPFGKGGLNAFAYCKGDPINFSDPSGQFLQPILGAVKVVHSLLKTGWKSYTLVLRPSGEGLARIATLFSRGGYATTAVGGMLSVGGSATGATVTSVGGSLIFTGKLLKYADKVTTVVRNGKLVDGVRRRVRQLRGQSRSAADSERANIRMA